MLNSSSLTSIRAWRALPWTKLPVETKDQYYFGNGRREERVMLALVMLLTFSQQFYFVACTFQSSTYFLFFNRYGSRA